MDVLYIAGAGRSGTTLLERIIAQDPRIVSVGEMRFLWSRGLLDNQLCGCGAPFRECPFWIRTFDRAFGGMGQVDASRLHAIARGVDRIRYLPALASPVWSSSFRERLLQYQNVVNRVYGAVLAESGAQLVVDSSKDVSTLALLNHNPSISLSVVHLVRDSRGVAYSWMKRKRRTEITHRTVYMPRYSPFRAALDWNARNAAIEWVGRRADRYDMVRYEDLIDRPSRTLQSLDLPTTGVRGSTALLERVTHTVSGNPIRFADGVVPLKPDDAWRSQMRPLHRHLVTLLTAPLLRRYGYEVR